MSIVLRRALPSGSRRVTDLMARGLLRRHRDGRPYRLTLTDDSRNRLCGTFDRLSRAAHQALADLDAALAVDDGDPATGCAVPLDTGTTARTPQLA